MLAEKALDLLRELQRTLDGSLPPYNEDGIRQILEEMKALFEQNQKDVSATVAGENGLFSGVQLRHSALERNKRCLLAYLYNRLEQIKKMRWEFGSVLPPEVKFNMCEQEVQWFSKYNKMLANYMRSIGGEGGLDLTQDLKPPKTLYIEVRCLMDHGEFETQDGNILLLKKNSQHFMLRSECEHLIRQGILEHIVH
ncbi:DNA replication complex GINS protein PSF1-like [Crassostrea angulata]|uniref:DNA replication complex GINS protein PSF1 n=2 Tax=Magallana gigas TaxID=29159 RepID=K1R2F6_MAGGI|nr:DNA replication complex GINS protein PSF1 [Crassostrea gigas]XP_052697770.1 DNA replication complex GINS protein PSF1-like [Crassostrea angulata]|eukprot:XP_011415824.1 PREDICTED: DNA replication complex GINS protein PSF1 [Crassostrea gigas]